MAFGDPTESAYFFVIDAGSKQYDAFFDINTAGEDNYGNVRYRELNSADNVPWVYLSPMAGNSSTDTQFDSDKMLTKAATDAEIDSVLANYSSAIKKVFGGSSSTIPESGIERVRWALKNNAITESNNVLTYNKPN